ncbi:glycine/betaine ABC transporter [Thalassobacillus devorans]|uniref:Glycine/betaine ABC transporter n=1 Tax=Thalassobacillus devorans TaxID=279813 RepID=A0ABQ1NNX0_9BACI|nr:glycine betaine ABC transporter substrate-binding protein [Thalassobacillus devorans]NIK29008.1 glycine betaine/proline transport system substrate-binding protein [Thalassobacillus devorans]GGC81868.1 glycine/betaine ABC transporter [Thalassobacillus devorans]
MKNLRNYLTMLALAAVLILAACGGDSDEGDNAGGDSEEKGTINIGMNNWAENVAVSNMWKIVLEEKGYDVELNNVEKGALYEALSSGDIDIGMEIWLPNTDKPFYEKFEDEIDWRETWYEGTDLALVVPSYVEEVNSIEDLNEHKEKFDSTIVGIDAGASIMELTDQVINDYDLDYSLSSSSEPTMISELKNSMEDEKPIVVTLWKPHWTFSEMDLKILEDPKNIYGDSENISYAARKGLEEDQPEVVEWFDNFMLNDDQLGSLMAEINEAGSPEEGAETWIEDNRDLIEEWTGSSE